jgi:hypothetical protein
MLSTLFFDLHFDAFEQCKSQHSRTIIDLGAKGKDADSTFHWPQHCAILKLRP